MAVNIGTETRSARLGGGCGRGNTWVSLLLGNTPTVPKGTPRHREGRTCLFTTGEGVAELRPKPRFRDCCWLPWIPTESTLQRGRLTTGVSGALGFAVSYAFMGHKLWGSGSREGMQRSAHLAPLCSDEEFFKLGQQWFITLQKFQVDNNIIHQLYIPQRARHRKSSCPLSPHS